jgi:hypothetical protein
VPQLPSASKAREITKGDCALIREILDKEKKKGNRRAAFYGLHNGLLNGRYTNKTSNGYGNMIPTSQGNIDLDWYATLAAYGAPSIFAHVSYVIGKTLWEIPSWLFKVEGSHRFEGPYRDPAESVAVDAIAQGLKFSDLFDQAWLDEHCRDK